MPTAPPPAAPFWSQPAEQTLAGLAVTARGLDSAEAARRLQAHHSRLRVRPRWLARLVLLGRQFNSPIIWMLAVAAALSFALQDRTDATIIFAIVLASGGLGYWHEAGAADAVASLLALVETKANVLRDGAPKAVPFDEVVPGDVVVFAAGDGVPGDCRLLESRDLFVNEAALTGETFPAEKSCGAIAADAPLARRDDALFMGTYVVSGQAHAVVVAVGADTEFGHLSDRLSKPVPTEFEDGVRHFGAFLMEVTLLLVIAIFAINVYLHKPVLESLLFSLALAVGLTPQLLPAIISVNLAQGARRMAASKVIVKRLSAIEDFGAMDVLCSDKTGTLTQGVVTLSDALDAAGVSSARVRHLAYLNASFETGMPNMIDAAICAGGGDLTGVTKLDEVPYDFTRKRLTVLVSEGEQRLMITKGALDNVLAACSQIEVAGAAVPLDGWRATILTRLQGYSEQGFRVLGVATRAVTTKRITLQDEQQMTFCGYILFFDPPKPGIADTIAALAAEGVTLKLITGDNRYAAAHIAGALGLDGTRLLTGAQLALLTQEALLARVDGISIFAEIEPAQKERIVQAVKRAGHVVGYMGDGINDGPALHAADVGISVNTAVAVAKEAAAIVLLEQDLGVLVNGVREGRITFANTLKYVFMATSANFGNMFSMAGASLFLPFLPLLPGQILLTNLLTDLPEMAIAFDSVDAAQVKRPRRWNIAFIRRFMLVFGLLSSVFDYVTFAMLLKVLHASPHAFQAGWFVESVASAALVVLVIRTRNSVLASRPAPMLLGATLAVVAIAFVLPATPLGTVFEFHSLPLYYFGIIAAILTTYMLCAEGVKWAFYRWLAD